MAVHMFYKTGTGSTGNCVFRCCAGGREEGGGVPMKIGIHIAYMADLMWSGHLGLI